jgi:hypothetical protein
VMLSLMMLVCAAPLLQVDSPHALGAMGVCPDRPDSEEFLGCFFSFAGSPKHRDWAPGRRVCPMAVALVRNVSLLWKLSVGGDSQVRPVAAIVASFSCERPMP